MDLCRPPQILLQADGIDHLPILVENLGHVLLDPPDDLEFAAMIHSEERIARLPSLPEFVIEIPSQIALDPIPEFGII